MSRLGRGLQKFFWNFRRGLKPLHRGVKGGTPIMTLLARPDHCIKIVFENKINCSRKSIEKGFREMYEILTCGKTCFTSHNMMACTLILSVKKCEFSYLIFRYNSYGFCKHENKLILSNITSWKANATKIRIVYFFKLLW